MKKVAYSLVLAAGLASSSVMAADMATKAPPAAAPPPSPWDVVVTAALMTDYNFRGITQSNHKPSTQAGFELRYNWNSNWQSYGGISGESIDFPNNAAAEIDFYGGIRPTFDKLALDFGVWYYYYPGGQCFNAPALCTTLGGGPAVVTPAGVVGSVPGLGIQPLGGNVAKENASFWEVYGKGTYTFNDQWAVSLQEWYSPSVVNTGAWGWYTVGNVTFTAPSTWFQNGLGMYVSGDLGYWDLGTSDAFYGTVAPAAPAWREVHQLHQLGRGRRLHLQGVHARSALLRHQPDQGGVQRVHQRAERDVLAGQCHGAEPERSRLQLVQRGLHRQALASVDFASNLK